MLDYIEAGPTAGGDRDADGRSREPTGTPTVVLCHGFGANMHDLAGIAREAGSAGCRWIFPQAPAEIPGYPDGRAWFPRSPGELVQFASGVDFHDLSGLDPDGLRASGRELVELLSAVGADLTRTVIGGFSQGAMVAVEAALEIAERGLPLPAGLVVLSGSLIAAERWRRRAPSIAPVPILQSHGRSDIVLPFAVAVRLRDLLSAAGATVEFVEFSGGHGVPPEVTARLAAFARAAGARAVSGSGTIG